ncbi:MAG: hypothetical protein HOY71_15660 [Nonomuraea sp.]|nr:hypothetical protein [Nonomuraea sp.]
MKTYTVTISGTEREDGEAPYTWAVTAPSPIEAVGEVLRFHLRDGVGVDPSDEAEILQELPNLRIEEIHEGLPHETCGYYWADYRDA